MPFQCRLGGHFSSVMTVKDGRQYCTTKAILFTAISITDCYTLFILVMGQVCSGEVSEAAKPERVLANDELVKQSDHSSPGHTSLSSAMDDSSDSSDSAALDDALEETLRRSSKEFSGFRSSLMKRLQESENCQSKAFMTEEEHASLPPGVEEFYLKRRQHTRQKGVEWHEDPTGRDWLRHARNWPRDYASLRGTTVEVEGKKWLLCTEIRQRDETSWRKAPKGSAIPFKYGKKYCLVRKLPAGHSRKQKLATIESQKVLK